MLNADAVPVETQDDEDALLDDLNQRLEALDPSEEPAFAAEDHEQELAEAEDASIEDEAVAEAHDDEVEVEAVAEACESVADEDAVAEVDEGQIDEEPVGEDPVAEADDAEVEDEPVAEAGEDYTEDAPVAEADEDEEMAPESVMKVSKEEFDAILASDRGEDVPVAEETDSVETEEAFEPSSLSAEDEQDLMRELAAVEAEVEDTQPAAEKEHEETDETEDEPVDSIFAERTVLPSITEIISRIPGLGSQTASSV